MKSAREWKAFYAREREELGPAGLRALVEAAPGVFESERGIGGRLPDRPPPSFTLAPGDCALVFPHTRLRASGRLTAAVARALVRSGCETVLALGVLHGAREEDRALVSAARAGDTAARATLRRVHGPGVADDAGRWTEEFSLDGLAALLPIAAQVEGLPAPRLVERYPFLTGERADDLPGVEELERLVREGAALVATADPIHHGVGYGTPRAACRSREDPRTKTWAEACVRDALTLLTRSRREFLTRCEADRSDFRDGGPLLLHLLGLLTGVQLLHLELVDYADVLGTESPTWVAGALLQVWSGSSRPPEEVTRCWTG